MKVGIIVKPNKKGQIVIPKEVRDRLHITDETLLQVVVRGSGIYLHPLSGVIKKSRNEATYVDLLKKTRGTWNEDWKSVK